MVEREQRIGAESPEAEETRDPQETPAVEAPASEETPEAESVTPEAETVATEAETVATEAETVAPEAEAVAPEAEAVAPEAEAVATEAEAVATEAETVATVAEPATAESPAEAETELETETASRSKKRWYVIHTYSGHENKVKANLERAIQYAKAQDKFGEVLVATEDYAIMKGGKKHITKRKTFPSYVLLEMDMNDETRALVQNISGVTHFVGDRLPTPLTEAEVRRIRGEEVREVGKVTTEVPFKVGESVKVTEGPFADFVGTVDEINLERGKLRVMVSIFGRPTAVELDLTHVTSI